MKATKNIVAISVILFVSMLCIVCIININMPKPNTEYRDANQSVIVAETMHYKIIKTHSQYYYYLYDRNHNVVRYDGPFNRAPEITGTNGQIIRVTFQAGTGIGTQSGYYYDTQNNKFSEIFQSIYADYDRKVIYGAIHKLIVQDIFEKDRYYFEVSSFGQPFSSVAEPIISAEFIDGGSKIKVTYYTGPDYLKETEILPIPCGTGDGSLP